MFIVPKLFNPRDIASGFSFNATTYASQEQLEKDLLGKKTKKMLFLNQNHTKDVAIFPGNDLKKPYDAIMTQRKGYFLFLKTADCNPILFYNDRVKVIGAIHAGWKGLEQKIITETLLMAQKKFNMDIESTHFSIGPSIRSCCYEVKEDLIESFQKSHENTEDFFVSRGEKIHFNQLKAIEYEFNQLGIKEEQVEIIDQCTHCSSQFFSYRKDKTPLRNLSFIGINA